jgi:hypothetical protein
MEPDRDGGQVSAAAAVAVAIGVAIAVLVIIHTAGGFGGPLQAPPPGLAQAAHASGQG